jgi:hypothetical protein
LGFAGRRREGVHVKERGGHDTYFRVLGTVWK